MIIAKNQHWRISCILFPFLGQASDQWCAETSADRLAFHTYFHTYLLSIIKREKSVTISSMVLDYSMFTVIIAMLESKIIFLNKWHLKWLFASKRILSTANMSCCSAVVWNAPLVPHRQRQGGRLFYLHSAALSSLPVSLWVWFADVVSTLFFLDLSEC